MQDARRRSEDRFEQEGVTIGEVGALGGLLLRWARGAAVVHALESAHVSSSRGGCAAVGEGVTVEERMALLDGSDRAVRARARWMIFGAVR